jgi:magnesium transporter
MTAQMEKAAIAFVNQISKTPYRQEDTNQALAEMPAAVADEVLRRLHDENLGRPEFYEPVAYASDSAGGMMDPSVIKVSGNATVAETLAAIRTAGLNDDLHTVFVVDDEGRYVGNLQIRLLLTRPEEARVESLVDSDSLFVRVDTGREEVHQLFRTHNLTAMPVLDHDDLLVGRVIRNGE